MPRKDPEARRAYHREYMRKRLAENPEVRKAHHERVRKNNERYRLEINALVDRFRARGCQACPEQHPCTLTAHHVDPATKAFDVGGLGGWVAKSPKTIAAELRKCVCLCRNCHAKVHAGVLVLPVGALVRQHSNESGDPS